MKKLNPLLSFLAQAVFAVIVLLAFITENEVLVWITVIIISVLLTTAVVLFGYIFLQRFFEQISITTHWSYVRDDEYSGYSVKANRKFLGIEWSTKEYMSGSEDEAQRLVDLKNNK